MRAFRPSTRGDKAYYLDGEKVVQATGHWSMFTAERERRIARYQRRALAHKPLFVEDTAEPAAAQP